MAEGTLDEPLEPRALAKATAIAALLAGALLVTVVLPQAYGLDPAGLGTALGTVDEQGPPVRSDTFNVTFAPASQGNASEHEFKLVLEEGATVEFAWNATSPGNHTPSLYFDRHGEPENAPKGEFTSYETGIGASNSGTITAPFTGTHGWYWNNDDDANVTVTLTVTGRYKVLGQIS